MTSFMYIKHIHPGKTKLIFTKSSQIRYGTLNVTAVVQQNKYMNAVTTLHMQNPKL